MSRRPYDLLAGMALAALSCALVLSGANRTVLGVVAIPLVLWLPGYALTELCFPKRPGMPEHLLLSLGASIGVTVLGGLVLHWSPWGLSPSGWALVLAGVTLTSSGGALARRRLRPSPALISPLGGIGLRQRGLIGAAALVLAGAWAVAVYGASSAPVAGVTQLWMLPDSAGDPAIVRVGVTNHEAESTRYELRLRVDSTPVGDPQAFELAPGGTWENRIALPAGATAEATLVRDDTPDTIYRRVLLWRSQPDSVAGQP